MKGLKSIGFEVTDKLFPAKPGDVLVMWNRLRHESYLADRFKEQGGRVLVAENGYLGRDDTGKQLLALSEDFHNGCGKWKVGGAGRWKDGLKPWRDSGEFILVLPQRGIGPTNVAMPSGWESSMVRRLRNLTQRPIVVRPHPGATKEDPYKALKGAWAVATWGSGAAIKALWAGYPVFYELRNWVGAPASVHISEAEIENPFLGDRLPMFERLAWSQWSGQEIESGKAFRCLLG